MSESPSRQPTSEPVMNLPGSSARSRPYLIGDEMALKPTEKIWHNGKLIPWDDAKLHIMAHVVNYGSSVFEGVRCYKTKQGAGIFRAQEHAQRLLDSAKIYRMYVDFTRDDIVNGMVELCGINGVIPC